MNTKSRSAFVCLKKSNSQYKLFVIEFTATFVWVLAFCFSEIYFQKKSVINSVALNGDEKLKSHNNTNISHSEYIKENVANGFFSNAVIDSYSSKISNDSFKALIPHVVAGCFYGIFFCLVNDISGGQGNPAISFCWWLMSFFFCNYRFKKSRDTNIPSASGFYNDDSNLSFVSDNNVKSLDHFSSDFNLGSSADSTQFVLASSTTSLQASLNIFVQYIGAFVASHTAAFCSNYKLTLTPTIEYGMIGSFLSEFIGTMLFVYILLVMGNVRTIVKFPLGIQASRLIIVALSYIIISTALRPFSSSLGLCMNPALASSLIISSTTTPKLSDFLNFSKFIPFWLGPYAGSTAAFLFFSGQLYSLKVLGSRIRSSLFYKKEVGDFRETCDSSFRQRMVKKIKEAILLHFRVPKDTSYDSSESLCLLSDLNE